MKSQGPDKISPRVAGRGGSGHGPSQSDPYSRVRDLLATITLIFFLLLLENEEVEKLQCKLSAKI